MNQTSWALRRLVSSNNGGQPFFFGGSPMFGVKIVSFPSLLFFSDLGFNTEKNGVGASFRTTHFSVAGFDPAVR